MAKPAPTAADQKRSRFTKPSASISNDLDALLNLVGELVINRTRISDISNT